MNRKDRVYSLICEPFYVPMKFKELAMMLRVKKEDKDELRSILEELKQEGKVTQTKSGQYLKNETSVLKGIFRGNEKGFGFVAIPGEESDIFIGDAETLDAFDGDEVEVILTRMTSDNKARRNRAGKVVRIISRNTQTLVGLYQSAGKNYGFVIPDNQRLPLDVFVPAEQRGNAKTGEKVVVRLNSYGGKDKNPEGKVIEILGEASRPDVELDAIIRTFGFPDEFPERVLNQAKRVARPVSEADQKGRLDLRGEMMITIDGEDAKDLDDAVSLHREGNNYVLGVHIADVTNYVQENSALDREALKRGTSVYLAGKVLPMLPKELSNGICSLNAGEDRLALSCIMKITPNGEIKDHQIAETTIHVNYRMSYTGVRKILEDHDEEERKKYAEILPMLEQMKELSDIIRERRKKRGSIDFDFPESRIIADETGYVQDIVPYERNSATKMIEDFMLTANETVAETFFWQEIPFLYRVHQEPEEDKIRELARFVANFGLSMHVGKNEIRPKEVQKLLEKIEGMPQEALITRITLRTMRRAVYTAENSGHFGLASPCYTHFTSPIRRYPDLQIHRIIKEYLRGRLSEERKEHYRALLPVVAGESSRLERRAEEGERETLKLKKAEYMSGHIGEVYSGVISGVTKWGIYVELANTVEGLVHVVNMKDDYYDYHEDQYEMVGERTGTVYKLGQQVSVEVAGADPALRTVDFNIDGSSYS